MIKRMTIDTTRRTGTPSQVVVDIHPDGRRVTWVQGVKGAGCHAAAAPYELRLPGEEVQQQPTAEMYEVPEHQQETEHE